MMTVDGSTSEESTASGLVDPGEALIDAIAPFFKSAMKGEGTADIVALDAVMSDLADWCREHLLSAQRTSLVETLDREVTLFIPDSAHCVVDAFVKAISE